MEINTKIIKELAEIKREVQALRTVVIGLVGKDEEGEYQPGFVEKVLKAEKSEIVGEFRDEASFLAELK